ncbi:hypothetical protein BDV97DRAFT_178356 [Delphinella strobiligena]|nr:hypothetical protein BDV97DRAFT_178356 [Delphinella strobiligena]
MHFSLVTSLLVHLNTLPDRATSTLEYVPTHATPRHAALPYIRYLKVPHSTKPGSESDSASTSPRPCHLSPTRNMAVTALESALDRCCYSEAKNCAGAELWIKWEAGDAHDRNRHMEASEHGVSGEQIERRGFWLR